MSMRTLCAAALFAALPAAVPAAQLLVPAYFYPSYDPAISLWDDMTAALGHGAAITAIANPANGPGAAPNSDYMAAIDAFRAAGGRVVGYVYTCYGTNQCASGLPPTRSVGDVEADIQRWADWYRVDGIFLDEMSNRASDLPFYATIANDLRTAHPGWKIFGNPGTATIADYQAVADTLVTFEGAGSSYSGAPSQPWMESSDPSHQAALFYDVADSATMQSLLQQATQRHAGYVYLTDDRYTPGNPAEPNPWDSLPAYWSAEVAAVAAVPEPHPVWLGAVGAALLLRLARRRR